MPCLFDLVDVAPCPFDLVAAGEERGVAAHGVEEETFVGFGAGFAEAGAVLEVHFDAFHANGGAGDFGLDAEGDAFVGLDADDEDIGGVVAGAAVEEDVGRLPEVDADFGGLFGELFADAEVEGDPFPAPVVDVDADGGVGLGHGIRGDAVFFAVAWDGFAAGGACGVLGADDIACDVGGVFEGSEGFEDLDFFVADPVGGEVGRGFHGGEHDELEEMVLDHVAETAGFVVIAAAAAFHAEVFSAGDLDVVDVAVVPDRFEEGVAEPEDHEVLGGFLAEVVVDSVGVAFLEGFADDLVESVGGGEVGAEGFFDDGAGPFAGFGLIEAGGGEPAEDDGEVFGGDGEVEEAISAGTGFVEGIEETGEAFVACGVFKFGAVVEDVLLEAGPELVVVAGARDLAVHGFEFLAEAFVGFFAAGEADDLEGGREFAVGGDVVEGRDEFTACEVAAGSEDDYGAGFRTRAGGKVLAEWVRRFQGMSRLGRGEVGSARR